MHQIHVVVKNAITTKSLFKGNEHKNEDENKSKKVSRLEEQKTSIGSTPEL